jgi:hypothetical protein
VDDAAAVAHGVERWRPPAVPDQVGITIIFENRHVVRLREPQQLTPARFTHNRASRILHGRDDIDVFGADAAPLEVIERCGDRVNAHAVIVERNAHRIDTQSCKPRQRALIAFLLDENGVTGCEQ